MNFDNLSSLNTVTTDLINPQESLTFPKSATTAEPLFFRSYSRKLPNGNRETWYQATLRVATYLKEVGKLTNEEFELIFSQQLECKSFFSGRLNWVAGTEWLRKPENFYGAFNCNSTNITDIESFGLLMNLAMQGTGTGAVLEPKYIEQLPVVCNRLNVQVVDTIGSVPKELRIEKTEVYNIADKNIFLYVGDSRQGWVDSYTQLPYLATDPNLDRNLDVKVFVGNVRSKGEDLKGFGGVANPVKLPELYGKVVKILNNAFGRQLTAVECCSLIDYAAYCIVAGGIRRSAGMRQVASEDVEAGMMKDNLWIQTEDGQWQIDPERDHFRMANHTRVFHHKPTLEEVTASVTKQYYSGEGAIQFAPEAIARANADLLDTDESRKEFIQQYCISEAHGLAYLEAQARYQGHYIDVKEAEHRLSRYGTNPCGEIIGSNLFCNLGEVHLNRINPFDLEEIRLAFKAASISVCTLLQQGFVDTRYQYSRDLDPIVGVSFTGLFDFFVNAFGVDWLKWWEEGRCNEYRKIGAKLDDSNGLTGFLISNYLLTDVTYSDWAEVYKEAEKTYLQFFKSVVNEEVTAYCVKHGLKVPNRYTTCQPAGSKSLLTGASAGWHPPKASVYIRRMTFDRDNPIALACMDYGYNVIPGQSDKDENGNLLTDPHDPRCTEWLVEIPFKCCWADLPGATDIDVSKFSVAAQYDFYMQVQQHYTKHNCFSGDTEFWTSEGIKKFTDFQPGEVVKVLNKDGFWADAEIVRTEDKRDLYKITLTQGSTKKKKEIIATGCHRFPTRRSSGGNSKLFVKTTVELTPGVRLVTNEKRYPILLDRRGIQNGIVHGDGCLARQGTVSQVYLCHDKRELKTYFDKEGSERDDLNQTQLHGLSADLKAIPSPDCSQEYLAGFVAGLIATDGNICGSTISIATSNVMLLEFLKQQLPRLGILITGEYLSTCGGYENSKPSHQIRLSKETVPSQLFLRTFHKGILFSKESQPRQWRVVSVEKLETQDYAWCVMEKETNHFTLTDNILVMNTSATLELREAEIPVLSELIHNSIQNDEGYISAALLARFDSLETFPRLPFEPITLETYNKLYQDVLDRRKSDDFISLLAQYDQKAVEVFNQGAAGCDSDKCLMPEVKPLENGKKPYFEAIISAGEYVNQDGSLIFEDQEQIE